MSANVLSRMNKNPILAAGVAAAIILATAFGFQLAGYHPCEMCWWQRYPYMAIMAVMLIALAFPKLPTKGVLWLLAGLFALDAGLAMFHVGVEQRWWEGVTTCSSSVKLSDNINDAMKAIMDAPLIRCDEIAWSLFGISMAGYNFIAASIMTLFCGRHALK